MLSKYQHNQIIVNSNVHLPVNAVGGSDKTRLFTGAGVSEVGILLSPVSDGSSEARLFNGAGVLSVGKGVEVDSGAGVV